MVRKQDRNECACGFSHDFSPIKWFQSIYNAFKMHCEMHTQIQGKKQQRAGFDPGTYRILVGTRDQMNYGAVYLSA